MVRDEIRGRDSPLTPGPRPGGLARSGAAARVAFSPRRSSRSPASAAPVSSPAHSKPADPSRVLASLRDFADRYLDFDPVVIEPGVRTGIAILAENPKEVGADRIANAVAAYDIYGGPTIVVDFGTATTCDAVSANGEYLGGAIAPGIEISMDALVGRAAALRAVEMREPRNVLGKSTVESIQSGAVYGFAAQVDGLCTRIQDDLGTCTVISTGGLADLISPLSRRIEHSEPWLTLHGLR